MRSAIGLLGRSATPLAFWLPAAAATSADRDLAAPCRGCHAETSGRQGDIPPLHERTREQLAAQLLAYKRDARQGTLMNRIAKGYSDAELERLAVYLGKPQGSP